MSITGSDTESDTEHELATDAVTSLAAFAHSSATRSTDSSIDKEGISWAVDTLATLDFRLIRKDDALHDLVQKCASTILALFDSVLQLEPTTGSSESCDFMSHVASILRPSFLHLLFQYRRLFRVIAAKDFKSGTTPLAIVCWVDVILAKLGEVITYVAVGPDWGDLEQSLPESLKAHREEDNLRAAIQLPDNWDMLPAMLLSERVSTAAKRLSVRLMLGRYLFHRVLSGKVGVDDAVHQLLATFSEFVRQSAARVGDLRSISGPDLRFLAQQERLMGAMTITLFAAADLRESTITEPERIVAFRPQTMAAAIQLLRFVLDEEAYLTQATILSPSEHLDIPSSFIMRWGIVPQWTWSIWLEYHTLYADTIMHITTTYIQHCSVDLEALDVTNLISVDTRSSFEAAVVNMIIDLIFRFVSALSTEGPLSASMTNVLHGSCRLISQWMYRNSCGIQSSNECCRALITLFGWLGQNEQHHILNDLVIECLSLMRSRCTRDAWKAAVEDSHVRFLEALDQSFMNAKTALSRNDLPKSTERHAAQLMQFLTVMVSRKAGPLNLNASADFVQAVEDRTLAMPPNERELLCETLLTCRAAAKMSGINLPNEATGTADEIMWHLGICSRDMDFALISAFSLYITAAPVNVEPLTYLEGLECLLDSILLICTRQHSGEDEPLALIVLPTICDALTHLLEHRDDVTGVYTCANTRIAALGNALRALISHENSEYSDMLRRRLPRWLIGEEERGQREHEMLFCRMKGESHLLYVTAV